MFCTWFREFQSKGVCFFSVAALCWTSYLKRVCSGTRAHWGTERTEVLLLFASTHSPDWLCFWEEGPQLKSGSLMLSRLIQKCFHRSNHVPLQQSLQHVLENVIEYIDFRPGFPVKLRLFSGDLSLHRVKLTLQFSRLPPAAEASGQTLLLNIIKTENIFYKLNLFVYNLCLLWLHLTFNSSCWPWTVWMMAVLRTTVFGNSCSLIVSSL